MKKKILIFLLALALTLSLASCDGIFNKNNGNAKKEFSRIVYVDEDIDITAIRSAVASVLGNVPSVTDSEPAKDGEIVFGNANREITAKAKAALATELGESDEFDCGYVIYVEGSSLAVYWDTPDMMVIAVSKFIDYCIEEKRLELSDGIAAYEYFERTTYEKDKHWLKIEAVAGQAVVASLKRMYNFFDGAKIADFYANLWDPETGGFYYTMSARDNHGFLPDIESTGQIIAGMKNNGAYDDINAAYPTELKQKILDFVWNMQSESDGYFYHPQWSQNKDDLQTDRYGRDMTRATDIISYFKLDTDGDGVEDKLYPRYCAPNGVKCKEHTGTDEKCLFPIASINLVSTTSLSSSVSAAVSRLAKSTVSATASVSSHPDYSSRAAFSAWLEEYNATIKENSGKAHNLSAIRAEITQHGYEDIVLDHLDRVQREVFEEQKDAGEEPTGLWQRYVDYNAIWGLLKYSGYYNAGSKGRAIGREYLPYIIKTCIKVIELPANGDYASNDLYNQWDSIARVLDNAKDFYGDSVVEELRDILREKTASLIDNSLLKIEDLKLSNGSCSLKSDGTSPDKIYGTHISLGIVEGNVNSTNIICSMYNSVYECLGFTPVPIMTHEDGERFIETISALGPVEKNELAIETLDFEDGKLPASLTQSTKNPEFELGVVNDPEDSSNSALYIASPEYQNMDYVYFEAVGNGSDCYIFESKIYVHSDTVTSKDKENIVQLKLGNYKSKKMSEVTYMLILQKDGNRINVNEATTTSSGGTTTTLASIGLDTWFDIRIEYYSSAEGNLNGLEAPMIKVWLDDELIHVSSNYYGSHESGAVAYNVYDAASVNLLKSPSTYIYLDDCFFSKENKAFDEYDETISDSRD